MPPPVIICFWDSLTDGYQSATPAYPTIRETPCGLFLQERLRTRARIEVSGVCGELTADMAMRFRRDVLERKPDVVVILGGTNDLGWNARPEEIMRNLLKMYEQARGAGIKLMAVTVPSLRPSGGIGDEAGEGWLQDHLERRGVVNGLIENYCRRRNVICVDLFAEAVESETGWLAARFSNDGLHLTTEGYRRFADLVYRAIESSGMLNDER
jgi:lysophospholipase L1-like esterase